MEKEWNFRSGEFLFLSVFIQIPIELNAPKKRWIWCALCRDTAGQERFRTITTAYYRGAMVILPFLLLTTPSLATEFLKSTCLFAGYHVSLRHQQWEILWKYKELDQKHWRGGLTLVLFGRKRCVTGNCCQRYFTPALLISRSTPRLMWRRWSWVINVTWLTGGRCLRTGVRRWMRSASQRCRQSQS